MRLSLYKDIGTLLFSKSVVLKVMSGAQWEALEALNGSREF